MPKARFAHQRRILIQTVAFPTPSFYFDGSIIHYLYYFPKLVNDVGIEFPVLGWVDGFGSRTGMGRIFAFAENNEIPRSNPHECGPLL